MSEVDPIASTTGAWDDLRDEVARVTSALIRFDTTNPPGNETACLEWVRGELANDGITAAILESAPGRGNLVARLPADGEPEGPALMLAAHVDVVAAPEPETWTHPPFAGVVTDGWVWGRGALDMKGPAATWITIVRALKRWRVPLRRDIVLMLNADEEAGGALGAVWMLAHHQELIDAEASISEGGGMGVAVGERRYFLVGVDEKRSFRFTMTAHGSSGHAAIPIEDAAILHLARAVTAVGSSRAPARITETFTRCLTAIAESQRDEIRSALLAGLHPDTVDATLDRWVPSPLRERLRAMVRPTFVPTILRAGEKDNLVPDRATAIVNCRTLPEDEPASIRAYVEGLLAEAGVADKVRLEFVEMPWFPPAPLDHPLLDSLTRSMAKNAPMEPVIPMVAIAGSDNRHLRAKGVAAFGFYPMPPEVDPRLFHNTDERISLDQLAFGTRVIGDAVLDYCRRV